MRSVIGFIHALCQYRIGIKTIIFTVIIEIKKKIQKVGTFAKIESEILYKFSNQKEGRKNHETF